jgi:hypothetical protein
MAPFVTIGEAAASYGQAVDALVADLRAASATGGEGNPAATDAPAKPPFDSSQ